ncbi:hypothetical protein K458DRAFT_182211 [Lentithecium fluviatile CBS 122367]|uniref:F-box domain-containing protein n=1 Tax=Lentithecium fluviatile CBS 122367 TaxID=1168545 RepID=A0A6G1IDU2_9PLEO|nr:hypothetical protein K458DRAFT_182211 [Lentithecium fluviatile CBS 122367]
MQRQGLCEEHLNENDNDDLLYDSDGEFCRETEEKRRKRYERGGSNTEEMVPEVDSQYGRLADEGDTDAPRDEEIDEVEDEDWIIDEEFSQSGTFNAVAHMFESQRYQSLRPASSGNHGRLPNEIYCRIIEHVDEHTRTSSLAVSWDFRDYASDGLYLSNGLSAVSIPNKKP